MAASRSSTATPMWSIRANMRPASLRKEARRQCPEPVLQALDLHPAVEDEVVDDIRAQDTEEGVGDELGVLLGRRLRDQVGEVGAVAGVDVRAQPAPALLHREEQIPAVETQVDHRL